MEIPACVGHVNLLCFPTFGARKVQYLMTENNLSSPRVHETKQKIFLLSIFGVSKIK